MGDTVFPLNQQLEDNDVLSGVDTVAPGGTCRLRQSPELHGVGDVRLLQFTSIVWFELLAIVRE